jgi:hypothetical protein
MGFAVAGEPSASTVSTGQQTIWCVVAYLIVVWCLLAVPALVTFAFVRLAKRAALAWPWIALVAGIVGLSVGTVRVQHIGPHTALKVFDMTGTPVPTNRFMVALPLDSNWASWRSMGQWYMGSPLQPYQLILPVAVAAALLLWRARQQAMCAKHLSIAGC